MKTKRMLALIMSIIMLLSVVPTTVFAYYDDEFEEDPRESIEVEYTLPRGVTMKPLNDYYLRDPDNYGDDLLFVIEKNGRYYAMKDVPAKDSGYSSIPAVDVTDWINPDGTLTVPEDTLGVAFWRYENYEFYINGRNEYLAYDYDYKGLDGDSDYSNDVERIYTGEFLITTEWGSTPYYSAKNKINGTLSFSGSWYQWINDYNYIFHTYEMIVDLFEDDFGGHYFKFRYLGTDVEYEGDEVAGRLYYADCRHQYTIKHAEYDPPTCMDKGCMEYWYCEGCERYSTDEDFSTMFGYRPVLPALGHNYGDTNCLNCQRDIPEYTKITSYEQFRTIKAGASFIMVAEIDDGNGEKEYYVLKEPTYIAHKDADEDGVSDLLVIDDNNNDVPDLLEQDLDGDGVADAMMYDGFLGDEYLDGVLDYDEIDCYIFDLENEYNDGYMADMRILDAIKVTPINGKINVKDLGALEIYMERKIPDDKLEEQYYGDGATKKDYENDFIFRIPNYWIRPMVSIDNNYYQGHYDQGDSKWWGVLFGKDVKELNDYDFENYPDDAAILYTEGFQSINTNGELKHGLRFLINGEEKNFVITSEYFWEELEGTQIPIYLYSSDAGDGVHQHQFGSWISLSDELHKRVCTVEGCDEYELGGHIAGEGCRPDPDNVELGHFVTCTICGLDFHEHHTREKYNYRYPNMWWDAGDGINHVVYCTECDGPAAYEEHTWGEWFSSSIWDSENQVLILGHRKTCTEFPCPGEMWSVECIYDEGVVTTLPTCTEPGIITYTCLASDCQFETKTYTEEIPALGHEWSEWQTAEGNPEKEFRVCKNDPEHIEERDVVTHDHIWSEWEDDGTGLNHVCHCTVEGCQWNQKEAHEWDNGKVTSYPTCEEAGSLVLTCTICEYSITKEIPELGHTFSGWTPNTDDKTHSCECICGEMKTEDHVFDQGYVIKEPTYTDKGLIVYTCTECGYFYNEILEMLNKDGFIEEDGKLYYYKDGKRVTGWFQHDGVTYYASSTTNVVINYSKTIGGKYYLWNDKTGLEIADGFVTDENGTKCYDNGINVIGWRHADGSGPKVENGISEQYSSNPEGLYYFLSTTGYMVTESTYKLGGYIREFNEDHTVKPMNGLQTYAGELYYYVDGVKQTGWHTIDGTTYYFRASDAVYGRAATKWMYISNKVYYFYATTSATPYALKNSGAIGGITYTYHADGYIIYNGFVNCDYANAANNNTAANIQKMNGTTRYYKNGEMQTGWQNINGNWYYFYAIGSANGSGYMCVQSRTIGGVWYEFTENGVCTNKQ